MAGWTTRLVLLFVILCFVASVCEARGSRGGGRGGGRYRFRSRVRGGGSYGGGGGGGANAGMIVGIIFGVIGGIVVLVVVMVLCKVFCCSDTGGSAKYSSSGGVVLANRATTINPQPLRDTTTTSPYDNGYKSSYNHDVGVQPPSYESAVSDKDALPYSPQPGGNLAYPPDSSYPANSSGLSYSADASGSPYPSNPVMGDTAPSAPSYGGREGGPEASGGPGPIGFERGSLV